MHSPRRVASQIVLCGAVSAGGIAQAATLPAHAPLRVLVVSDEVNPNGLSDADLTQPGDISSALNADDSGLELAADATEVSSQCVDDALTALEGIRPLTSSFTLRIGARLAATGKIGKRSSLPTSSNC